MEPSTMKFIKPSNNISKIHSTINQIIIKETEQKEKEKREKRDKKIEEKEKKRQYTYKSINVHGGNLDYSYIKYIKYKTKYQKLKEKLRIN